MSILTTPAFEKAFEKLNEEQRKAVTSFQGPVLVVAGPGTGKTQVLSMRIAYILLHEEIKPQNILAITFTESGVAAMRERLVSLIGSTGYYVHIKTFHGFCNDCILEYPEKFGAKSGDFSQLTDLERYKIIQEAILKTGVTHLKPFKEGFYFIKSIIANVQNLKKEGVSPQDFKKIVEEYEKNVLEDPSLIKKDGSRGVKFEQEWKKVEKNKEFLLIYQYYQEQLKIRGRYDYDDMIMFVVDKLQEDEEFLRTLQEQYLHFLIDEYQDTNGAQNKVIATLASFFENPNLFAVGDDDQSIYRFQGASLENMLQMKHNFKNTSTIVLHKNYRSTQTIIDAATSVIEKNEERITNPIYGFAIEKSFEAALKKNEEKVNIVQSPHGMIENYFLVQKIQALIKEGRDPKSIAVIYRHNQDADDIIELFSKNDIPWSIRGGTNILHDTEVITFINLLRTVQDPENSSALFQVLQHPALKIPPLDFMKLSRMLYNHKANKTSLIELITNHEKLAENGIQDKERIEKIGTDVLFFFQSQSHRLISELAEGILKTFGLLDFHIEKNNIRTLQKITSLFSFIKIQERLARRLTLTDLIQDLDLMQSEGIQIKEESLPIFENGIQLMTAHSSKGLEFETVFIVKCIEGKWGGNIKREAFKLPPNILEHAPHTENEIEDERRLFYVALTRAKQTAYILHSYAYPALEKENCIRSRFIEEMSPDFLQEQSAEQYEQDAKNMYKILFEQKVNISNEEENYIKSLVAKYRMNPIGFLSFLECPRRFFYENILRLPRTQNKLQHYGTAIHEALENLFKNIQQNKPISKELLLEFYTQAVDRALMNDEDQREVLEQGKKVLAAYYDFYADTFVKPLYLERDYNRIPVNYKDIPLSGKIDKVQWENKESNTVCVIDYKTGNPRSANDLKGETARKDFNYFYQLMFYKLLLEHDESLNVKVESGMIDFVALDSDKKSFKQVKITWSLEEFEAFLALLEKAHTHIVQMQFQGNEDFPVCNDCEYCRLFFKETLF